MHTRVHRPGKCCCRENWKRRERFFIVSDALVWGCSAAAAETHHKDHVIKYLYANKEQQTTEVAWEPAPLGVTLLQVGFKVWAPKESWWIDLQNPIYVNVCWGQIRSERLTQKFPQSLNKGSNNPVTVVHWRARRHILSLLKHSCDKYIFLRQYNPKGAVIPARSGTK